MIDFAPISLIVLDWDGTVIDSAAQIVAAMHRTIASFDLPSRSDAELRDCIGMGLADALWRLFPDVEQHRLAEAIDRYSEHFRSVDAPASPLFPGVREALHELKARGYRLAVATGKSRRGLEQSLRDTGLGDLFEATRCADDCRPKPDPQMLEELLWEIGLGQEQALMVGDTEYDMGMARAARVLGVGVCTGVHDAPRLERAGAAHVLPDVADLPRHLPGKARGIRH